MFAWFVAVCFATPMWVEPDRVEAVGAALVELWPDGPLELRACPPGLGDGVVWQDGLLTVTRGGDVWTTPAADARTAVLIARSRLATRETPPTWIPPLPPQPEPEPEPEAATGSATPWVAVGAQVPLTLYVSAGLRATIGLSLGRGYDLAIVGTGSPRDWAFPVGRFVRSDQVTPVERFGAAVYGTWNLGRAQPPEPVEPILLAGAEVRVVDLLTLGPKPNVVDGRIEAGPMAGAGMQLPVTPSVDLRLLVTGRVHWGGLSQGEVPVGRNYVTPSWVVEGVVAR